MVAQATLQAEQIQGQMRQVRRELREDVEEIVTSARVMADWQYYVRRHPWLCVGGAALAGFVLVPLRPVVVHPDAQGLLELARANELEIKMDSPAGKQGGILSGLASALALAAVQAGLAAANHLLREALEASRRPQPAREGARP